MSEPREIILGPGQEVVVRAAAPGGNLTAVLDAIVAEGHIYTDIRRWPTFRDEMRWECRSHLGTTRFDKETVAHDEWEFINHAGEQYGATPVEAAQNRLDQIRVGKSLTWLAFAAPGAE